MNDRSLAQLLAELDEALASGSDPDRAASAVKSCLEARSPGTVLRAAAGIQLALLGCASQRVG